MRRCKGETEQTGKNCNMRDVEIIPISIPRLNAGDPGRWAGGKLVCSTETSGNGGE